MSDEEYPHDDISDMRPIRPEDFVEVALKNFTKNYRFYKNEDGLTKDLNRRINDVAEDINRIFEKYNIEDKITSQDIRFTDRILYETFQYTKKSKSFGRNRKLSNIIFDHYYEKPNSATYYHFTTFDKFKSIVLNQQLRLFNLIKRFDKEEYRTFYLDHNLRGYDLNKDNKGESIAKSIMKEIYYISFAKASSIKPEEEDDLWSSFGDSGCGVRIEFEIRTKHPDFRSIHYSKDVIEQSSSLVKELVAEIEKKYSRKLVFSGLSKIGAFYLHNEFSIENEVRFVIKRDTDEYKFKFYPVALKNDIKYISLELKSSFAHIKIRSVQPGYAADTKKVKAILSSVYRDKLPQIIEKRRPW